METLTEKRKRLEKELSKVKDQAWKEFTDTHYPVFKQHEGKCFKKRNTYGGDCKGWWVYTRVVKISPEDVYSIGNGTPACTFKGWAFQITTHKQAIVDMNDNGYLYSIGKEISEEEFYEAYNKMMETIHQLP